ncbi:hypothetical protein Pres01_09090 [Metapseudomonas resinovorans]|nr:hypothetical protein Pres01_09090 [Pseudomonas resinovorans]
MLVELPAWAWQLAISCWTCCWVWPCSGTTVSAKAGRQMSEASRVQRQGAKEIMEVRLSKEVDGADVSPTMWSSVWFGSGQCDGDADQWARSIGFR